jgi:uncharacterized protein
MSKTSLNARQATRGLRCVGALLLTLALSLAVLAVPASAAIVLPDLPSDQCVVDDAGVLSQSTFTYFDELNGTLESSCSGAQIALLTVQYTGSAETEDYAAEAFNTWGVGSASENNGVLILLVMESPYYEDGDYYITLGDGFRNTTLSKQVSTIAQETMEDSFVAGDYDAAAQNCAAEIANMIADQYGVTLSSGSTADEQPWEESAPSGSSSNWFEDLLGVVVFLLLGFGMLMILISLLGSIFFVPVGRMFGWTWGPFGWYGRMYRHNPPRDGPGGPGNRGGPRGPGGMGGRPGNMGGPRGGSRGGRPGGMSGGSRPSGGSMGGGRSGGGFSSGGGGRSGGFGGMGGGGSHGGGGGRGR